MSGLIDMGLDLAAGAARFGWFYGLNQLVEREARLAGQRTRYRPKRPVPTRQQLLAEMAALVLADAAAVRDGLYPPSEDGAPALGRQLQRTRAMFQDLPRIFARRAAGIADSVRDENGAAEVPDYYAQDFHFQSGGYLSVESARLYDIQVETLFYGAANAMRRTALEPIAQALRGRDQRRLALTDVACGTGRLLRQIRLAWPALELTGIDLSQPYLDEAAGHLAGLRPARLMRADAAVLPLPAASQDIVTMVFLFHELPPQVRRDVTREIARVLKPGGRLVFIDSLQMGDRAGWDGLLEAFPVRFHEPYFRHYVTDDLDGMFADAGLTAEHQSLAFLSKVMVRTRS